MQWFTVWLFTEWYMWVHSMVVTTWYLAFQPLLSLSVLGLGNVSELKVVEVYSLA